MHLLTVFLVLRLSKYNHSPTYAYLKFEEIAFKANSSVLMFAHPLLGEFKYMVNLYTVKLV